MNAGRINAMTGSRSTAFTLVELLIVVAILAILASISYTIYANFFKMSFESEAVSLLQQAKLAQTEYFSENDVFACDFADLPGFSGSGSSYVLNPDKGSKRKFTISLNPCNSTAYTMNIINNSSDSDQLIEWELNCTAAQITSCEPEQKHGTGTLKNIF